MMCCAMFSGANAKDPRICLPQDSEFPDLIAREQQPIDWLGEGFAVKMDTKASNTPLRRLAICASNRGWQP
jgi:hypothetical protein